MDAWFVSRVGISFFYDDWTNVLLDIGYWCSIRLPPRKVDFTARWLGRISPLNEDLVNNCVLAIRTPKLRTVRMSRAMKRVAERLRNAFLSSIGFRLKRWPTVIIGYLDRIGSQ